jgi:transposase
MPDSILLYEDECSMSNTATVSYGWSKKGKQPQIQCKQRKRERQTVFGSYNYDTGQITVSFADRGNSHTFKRHLKKILATYKGASKVILVLDNVAYHHAKKIGAWLERHPVLELFFLPPYSPDLNAVERAWWYMRKKITHNRYLKTLKERKVAFWKMFSHFLKPNDELKIICEINY